MKNCIGQRFNFLTVVRQEPYKGIWCRCDCGTERFFSKRNVLTGSSKSCGCKRRELLRQPRASAIHRMSRTADYKNWVAMISRCHNPRHQSFPNYGGRGIKVCERWRKFENFLADMGPRPIGLTLDRINNNGDYEPSNCRWTDLKTQLRNKRNNVFAAFNGKTQTIAAWAEELGEPHYKVERRFRKEGRIL